MKNPWAGLGGLSRQIWILCGVILVNRIGTMVLPFLALYLTEGQKFTAGRAGAILALYGIGALMTAPLAGKLCDRYGAIRIMRLSLILSALIFFFFPFIRGFWNIAATTVAMAIVSETFRPASLAAVSHLVTPENRKAAFALTRLAINVGMSMGPAVGGFLASVSFFWLFSIDGATSLLAGLLLYLFRFAEIHPAELSKRPAGESVQHSILKDRSFFYFLAAVIPVAIVFFQHASSMPLFMVQGLGLSEVFYGFTFTINTMLIILLEVPINLSTTHWTHKKTLALGSFLVSAGFGLFAFAHDKIGIIAAVVVWTFGEMILLPGMTTYVADVAPQKKQGEYMGYYVMVFGVAFSIGPWLGVKLFESAGSAGLWTIMFLIGSVSTLMMLGVKEKSDLQSPVTTV